MISKKVVGILTRGGVRGLNPCIKQLVSRAVQCHFPVLGIRRVWQCFLAYNHGDPSSYEKNLQPLSPANVCTIDRAGGTILHTSRTNPNAVEYSEAPDFLKSNFPYRVIPFDAKGPSGRNHSISHTRGTNFMKNSVIAALLVILIGLALPASTNAATERPLATIGTGSLTGVYYSTGHAIAKTLDHYAGDQKIDLSVKETQGSLENLEAVTSGRFYFGIVQSDIQYKAWHGTTASPWEGKPQKNLRAVFSLYTEAINLVALSSRNINNLKDLKSEPFKVNTGEPGSGQYINANDLLMAVGIHPQDDVREVHVSPTRALELFEHREIDAFFFTAGHPAALFHEVAGGKRLAKFVTLNPEESLLKNYPYYSRTLIPVKYYPGMENKQDVATIGVRATVVTSADTPDWMVYGIVKAVAEKMGYFKSQLLVFQDLNRAGMLEGLSAPIHPGALKYYREAGLVP